MIAIEFEFPGGRFHATPWGRDVNEGVVEWPPSPWRLLRALLATWHRKVPHLPEADVREALYGLCAPPIYRLPDVSQGHTRHYMPLYNAPLGENPTKIFDAFLRIPRDATLVMAWPRASVSTDAFKALEALLDALSYLGRREAWVVAKALGAWRGRANCRPVDAGEAAPRQVIAQVLCPLPPEDYEAWRRVEVERQRQFIAAAGAPGGAPGQGIETAGRRSRGQRGGRRKRDGHTEAEIDAMYPRDLLTALAVETTDFRELGWSLPPGARYITYAYPRELQPIQVEPWSPRTDVRPTAARFALASDTVQGDVRPQITRGVYLAETIRQALMSKARDGAGGTSWIFAGKMADGAPARGHRHAYYLPCDDDGDGRIDHVVVFAREGFGEREIAALTSIRKLWQRKGTPDLFPVLVGIGSPEELDVGQDGGSGALGVSSEWTSATPYLLTRHPKKNGKDSPEDQVRKELERLGFPPPVDVSFGFDGVMTRRGLVRWSAFARDRGGAGRRAFSNGLGARIRFAEPVRGPIVLGYGAHFGLGLFLPVRER